MIYVDGIKTIETPKKIPSVRKQLLELDIAAYPKHAFKD